MTIEQLLCPEVIMWEHNFRKHLNESHIEMTDDEISEEFDKWLIENEELINKSVEDNIEHINETINRNMKKVNEGIFDEDAFDDDDDDEDKDEESSKPEEEKEEPVKKEKTLEDEPEEIRSKLTGAIRLNNIKDSKNNVFGVINEFYDVFEKEGINHEKNSAIMRKLDVSGVVNMSALFAFADIPNLDLSSWNTSRVKHMEGMFYKSTFNNDSICKWDVSACADFKNMFLFCPFNHSLKAWTPDFTTKTFKTEDGRLEPKMVRADLPILGGTEDEERAIARTYRRNLLKTLRDEAAAEGEVTENKNNNMKHVIDFDSFVNEGKFKDFIDKGVEKIKKFFKSIPLKVGKLVAFFKENGEMYPAVSAYTSLNVAASGKIPGVTAFCNVDNDYLVNVPKVADIVPEPGYYGIIDKDSIEYKNYQTFKTMVNEHYQKYGDAGPFVLNEDNAFNRVGFSAEDGGVVVPDINSDQLRGILERLVNDVPAYKGKNYGGAKMIFGAPGIGKSTIPKAIIKAWNNSEKGDKLGKKALMVVQCGDLTIDGFSLPIPVEKSIKDYLDERPLLKDKISKSALSADTLEKIKKSMHKVSIEAPKTWLPAFKMNATQEEIDVLNDIANGYLEIKYTDDGKVIKTETTEGGILLFDEFFRADENIFKIMMQIICNREYSGYMLGNKWGILCCSNRPNDDEEVRTGYEKTGPVVGNRFLGGSYNFIPSFSEWKKWAVTEGGFDEITIEFLMMEEDPRTHEYTNWHTIRPDEYINRGKVTWPTPRSWSGLMVEINNYMKDHNLNKITDIPAEDLKLMADGIIGDEVSARYVSFIQSYSSSIAVDAKAVLEDPNYTIPSSSRCSDVVRQVEHYITVKYDDTHLPDVKLLMNVFNKMNDTYSGSKDNLVKLMHLNIIKHFNVMKNKENRLALKDYLQATDERYHFDKTDFK